jgi:2-aminoadipate transaminase
MTPGTLARRAERLNPSTIREILKITERSGIISLAGGLPSADTFPVQASDRGYRQPTLPDGSGAMPVQVRIRMDTIAGCSLSS